MVRTRRRARTASRRTAARRGRRTSTRTRSSSRKGARGASRRRTGRRRAKTSRARRVPAVFAPLWTSMGNELVRLLKKQRGADRKSIARLLAAAPELRRLLVEQVARLIPASAPQPPGPSIPTTSALAAPEPTGASGDDLADEYAILERQAARRRLETEPAGIEDPANWRIF